METIFFQKMAEIKRTKDQLEKDLNVKIKMTGNKVTIEGEAFEEYQAQRVLEAIRIGFSAKRALILKDEDKTFMIMPIKNFTKRKNLREVRGRIIGREGKTKRTLESVSGCEIAINDQNEVGVIGTAEDVEELKTALTKLIKGSNEANVYRYLEQINTDRKGERYKMNQGKKDESKKKKKKMKKTLIKI